MTKLLGLGRNTDVLLALMVAGLVALLIIPLPEALLDVLLAVNISLSALILVVTLLAPRALDVSSFPSLLLLTTLFRLGLNVSTTRLILGHGSAGEVITAFGHFVVQGDIVVGVVIFLVITLVQFLVIAKGAERVAEVAARFTLDAMPGKQMSIEAALKNGAITEDEAQRRRDDLGRESQLFGAMDGAMKFVKGDAIAGLVITAINLVAGFIIGVLRHGLPLADALETYSILTIGDGLIAQIPALLITLAAGVITTRVAPGSKGGGLGETLRLELLSSPKVLGIGAALASALALVPGLPLVPFGVVALALGLGAAHRHKRDTTRRLVDAAQGPAPFAQKLEQKVKQAKAQRAMADQLAPTVRALELELAADVSEALGFVRDGGPEPAFVRELLPRMRDGLFERLGVPIPAAHTVTFHPHLPPGGYVVRLRGVPAVEGQLALGKLVALEPAERLARLGVAAQRTRLPGISVEASQIAEADREVVEASGIPVFGLDAVLIQHLEHLCSTHAKLFLGLQELSDLVDRLEKVCPALVRETIPKLVSLAQLVDIVRRLVDEGVSVRDLKSILETLAEDAPFETDNVLLTERVRVTLGRQIAFGHVGAVNGSLNYVTLDPLIEDAVRGAIVPVRGGHRVALEPEIEDAIIRATHRVVDAVLAAGVRPVVLAPLELRRYVRVVLARAMPSVPVLSYEELPESIRTTPFGRVTVSTAR